MATARLLTSISVLALLSAAPAWAASFTITDNQSGQQTLSGAETGTITSTGRLEVSGAPDAASAIVGTDAGSIDNAGYVSAAGTSNGAVKMTGTVTTLTNSGTMTSGSWTVIRIQGGGATGGVGTFTNTASGKIIGTADTTVLINEITGSLVNHGEITNSSTDGDGALVVRTLTGTLENTGRIEATSGVALWVGGEAAHVTNSGTIRSGGPTAILFQAGDDTLTLHASSDITGKVDGGIGSNKLQLGGADDGAFAVTLIGDQYLNFEKFSKTGTSKWTLAGTSALAANWTMDAGILSVAQSIANMNFELTGGTLMGGGTVGNVKLTDAKIAPGNSIGTLTVNDIIFGTNSIYEVEVSGTQTDRIVATGSATIDALAINVSGTPSTCGALQRSILFAAGGLNLNIPLNSILFNDGLTGATLTNDSYNLFLNFAGTGGGRTFSGYTNTANQEATAQALDALGCNNQPYAAALNALAHDDVPAAMDALSGEGHASIAAAMVENAHQITGVVGSRLEQAFDKIDSRGAASAFAGGSLLDPGVLDGLSIWGDAYGGLTQRASDGNAAAVQSATGGFVVGIDRPVSEGWIAGLFGGLGVSSISAGATDGQSLDATIGAYAGSELGVVKVKVGAAYTRHLVETSRSIVFPGVTDVVSASYQAGTMQGFVEVSTDIDTGAITLTPFAKLQGVSHGTEAFTETGGEGSLDTAASVANALFVTLGVGAEHEFVLSDTMLVTARGSIGWRHAFADQINVANSFAGGGPFTVASAGIARDVVVASAGASVDIDDRTSLDIGYEGSLGSGYASHALKVTLSGRF